ncbi:hypothetical protein RJK59_004337 [Salmonella enterica]|nr:hypothetical protein [Salmonella enterica]
MTRRSEQGIAATTESADAKRRCALQTGSFIAGLQEAPVTARQRATHPFTDAASLPLTLAIRP